MSLDSVIEANELSVVLQPQFDAQGKAVASEALVRWQHPTEGLIPPDDFIPIAEETNLILDIDEWVIREVARQQCQWKKSQLPLYPISINISAANISRPSLVSTFAEILQQQPFLEGLLQVEVTETAMMLDPDNATLTLNSLFSMGVPSSIDDFGSGYTSLGYLKKLNANILKIDRSFISGITLDNYDRDVAKAIIALASSMSMKVVAEGVETHEQWDMLRIFGCDYLQGFYFNRPLNGQKMTQILADKQKLLHG